jgi:hypothetical protein
MLQVDETARAFSRANWLNGSVLQIGSRARFN